MGNGHTVLGKSTGLVRANGRGRAQCLDSLQVLDQTVLLGHTLGSKGQTDSDSGEETFGDIGDNDTYYEEI